MSPPVCLPPLNRDFLFPLFCVILSLCTLPLDESYALVQSQSPKVHVSAFFFQFVFAKKFVCLRLALLNNSSMYTALQYSSAAFTATNTHAVYSCPSEIYRYILNLATLSSALPWTMPYCPHVPGSSLPTRINKPCAQLSHFINDNACTVSILPPDRNDPKCCVN